MTNQTAAANHKWGKYSGATQAISIIVMVAIGILLVALNVARIFSVSITHDECGSYFVAQSSYVDIINLKQVTANTHILNALLTRFFMQHLGDHLFWLRFSNLLAQIIYLLVTGLLSLQLFTKKTWCIGFFLVLNLQPLLFEFWGLSRGYGMFVAFMMGSVYALILYVQCKKPVALIAGLFSAILAVYSNFSALDYFCAVVFISFISPFINRDGRNRKYEIITAWGITTTACIMVYLLAASPLRKLVAAHELYYGGNNNIFRDTIISVLQANLHIIGDPGTPFLKASAIVVALFSVAPGLSLSIRWMQNKTDRTTQIGLAIWLMLLIPVACILLQHVLLHTLYPMDRTALYLIPLFLLSVTYWLYYIIGSQKPTAIIFFMLLVCLCIINFGANMNTTSTWLWAYNRNDLLVLNRIMANTKQKNYKNKLAVFWIFKPSMDYYTQTKYNNGFMTPIPEIRQSNSAMDTTSDYIYIPADMAEFVPAIYKPDTTLIDNWRTYYLYSKRANIY